MSWALFSHGNLSFFSEYFKLVSQMKAKDFLCPTSHCKEGGEGVALVGEG